MNPEHSPTFPLKNRKNHSSYIGRFAPSPSGSLHFGSLVAALASYLDAKHHHGQWLVRIEDIDPPREEIGAKERILHSLAAHGLEWDGPVMHQSQRLPHYADMLSEIAPHTYQCRCTRQRLLELKGVYDGYCLTQQDSIDTNIDANNDTVLTSTRLSTHLLSSDQLALAEHYTDIFQGSQNQSLQQEVGDFILRRKDNLFAYQLAVVADDIEQGVTHIIRGCDLLSSTPRQRYLTLLLQKVQSQRCIQLPDYGHTPIATNTTGQKLSKQNKAQPLDSSHARHNLLNALGFLNQLPEDQYKHYDSADELMSWAIEHWDRTKVPPALSLVVDDDGKTLLPFPSS